MKTIVITGGSSGIGRATALQLALLGHQVVAIGRNEERLTTLKSQHKTIEIINADIATQEGRIKVKNYLDDRKVDVLVNNAGIMSPSGPLFEIDVKSWRYQMSVNVEAPLFLSQLLLENLVGGRILNISIYSSYKITPGLACYGISKAALNMLTEYMRSEYEEKNISVGLTLPGIVNTNIQKQLPVGSRAHDIEKLGPDLVAKFLSWLTLDAAQEKFKHGVIDIYDSWHQSLWNTGPKIHNPLK